MMVVGIFIQVFVIQWVEESCEHQAVDKTQFINSLVESTVSDSSVIYR